MELMTTDSIELTAPQPVLGEGLNFSETWRSALPEDIRDEPSLQSFKSLDALAKSYVNAQRLIGIDKLDVAPIPNDNSSDAEWAEYYKRIGRPEAPDGYEFKGLPDIEGVEIEEKMLGSFKEAAHELGLTPRQAQGLHDFYARHLGGQMQEMRNDQARAVDDAIETLKSEYGYAYEKNLAIANHAIRTFDPDGVIEGLGLGNNPDIVKMMVNIGKAVAEDKMVSGGRETLTPDDAAGRFNEIIRDYDGPYYNEQHPKHQQVVAEARRLAEQAYGTAKVHTVSSGSPREQMFSR